MAVLVLPTSTLPAAFNRAATVPSSFATWLAKSGKPTVLRMPAVEWESFSVCGTPCSGPQFSPRGLRRVGLPCPLARGVDVDNHHGIQRAVVPFDLLQLRFQRLHRRNAAGADRCRQFDRAGKNAVRHTAAPGISVR